MGDITANFSRYEFACRCGCGLDDPHPILVASLQQLMDIAQKDSAKPLHFAITGPGRCAGHNETEGGHPSSFHLPDPNTGYFSAVDGHIFTMADTATSRRLGLRTFYEAALQVPAFRSGGIGLYLDDDGPRLHLDVRRIGSARWARMYGEMASIADVLWMADEAGRGSQNSGPLA